MENTDNQNNRCHITQTKLFKPGFQGVRRNYVVGVGSGLLQRKKEFSMKRKKERVNCITTLYERLSKDDENGSDSNSIIHQKQMLED